MKNALLRLGAFLFPGLFLLSATAQGVTLQELAPQPPKLFVARKGLVMPNDTDQTNNLKEGDKALLLSSRDLTDLTGISTLTVEDDGQPVPITSVKRLHLFLNRNRIPALPEEMRALKNVVFLYFEHNLLHELPRALMEMDSLEGMYFTENRFTEIPPFIFDMTNLRKLQFSKNHLTVLPPELGRLTELRHFNMSDNQIAVVPDTIANLTHLCVCDLSDNRISSLPEAFGKVPILYQLRVRNDPLTALPAGFANMPGTIDITGTKMDPAAQSPALRAHFNTAKAPRAGAAEKHVVSQPEKPQAGVEK